MLGETTVSLTAGQAYVTAESRNAFLVREGTVLLYLAPLVKGKLARRRLLFRAESGDVFPAFAWRDPEYVEWRLVLMSEEHAVLDVIEGGNTKKLRNLFCDKLQISAAKEGVYEAVTDLYRRHHVIGLRRSLSTSRLRKARREEADRLIQSAFSRPENKKAGTFANYKVQSTPNRFRTVATVFKNLPLRLHVSVILSALCAQGAFIAAAFPILTGLAEEAVSISLPFPLWIRWPLYCFVFAALTLFGDCLGRTAAEREARSVRDLLLRSSLNSRDCGDDAIESALFILDSADSAARIVRKTVSAEFAAVSAVAMSAAFFFLSAPIGLLATGLLILLGILNVTIMRKIGSLREEKKELLRAADGRLRESLGGIAKIRLTGSEDRSILEYLKPFVRAAGKDSSIRKSHLLQVLLSVFFAVVFAFLSSMPIGKTLSIPGAGAATVLFCLLELYLHRFAEGAAFLSLHASAAAGDISDAKPPESVMRTQLDPSLPAGMILWENVSYRLAPEQAPILEDLNLRISPGETVGIFGASGAGKTTLAKLISGELEPAEGRIRIGVDETVFSHSDPNFGISRISSDDPLIPGSIAENIAWGRPDQPVDRVLKTAEAAGIRKDPACLPMGIQTVLRDGAVTLSESERRRVLLARAILAGPDVLLLDAVFPAADPEENRRIVSEIKARTKTRILFSTRRENLIPADRIFRLDRGHLIEE